MTKFCKTSPCNNCPYRTDAPLQHWSSAEFTDLAASENTMMGTVYGCHKNDGSVCVGWLMDQDKRGFPSISLRMSLSKNNITRDYLDKLKCKVKLFPNIKAMIKANYPRLKV